MGYRQNLGNKGVVGRGQGWKRGLLGRSGVISVVPAEEYVYSNIYLIVK
jgi:hypothetical protein